MAFLHTQAEKVIKRLEKLKDRWFMVRKVLTHESIIVISTPKKHGIWLKKLDVATDDIKVYPDDVKSGLILIDGVVVLADSLIDWNNLPQHTVTVTSLRQDRESRGIDAFVIDSIIYN